MGKMCNLNKDMFSLWKTCVAWISGCSDNEKEV